MVGCTVLYGHSSDRRILFINTVPSASEKPQSCFTALHGWRSFKTALFVRKKPGRVVSSLVEKRDTASHFSKLGLQFSLQFSATTLKQTPGTGTP